jgi:hypothetical protein
MNRTNKILIPFLLFVLIIAGCNPGDKNQNGGDSLKLTNEQIISSIKSKYPEIYGGAYIENEKLNINLIGEVTNSELKSFIDNQDIIVHSVKYSLEQLNEAFNNISKSVSASIELNEKENKIIIYVDKESQDEIEKAVKNIASDDIVEFKENDNKGSIQF